MQAYKINLAASQFYFHLALKSDSNERSTSLPICLAEPLSKAQKK
jgi:hypothetical protein